VHTACAVGGKDMEADSLTVYAAYTNNTHYTLQCLYGKYLQFNDKLADFLSSYYTGLLFVGVLSENTER
jgi:hypothetical protein